MKNMPGRCPVPTHLLLETNGVAFGGKDNVFFDNAQTIYEKTEQFQKKHNGSSRESAAWLQDNRSLNQALRGCVQIRG